MRSKSEYSEVNTTLVRIREVGQYCSGYRICVVRGRYLPTRYCICVARSECECSEGTTSSVHAMLVQIREAQKQFFSEYSMYMVRSRCEFSEGIDRGIVCE